jgi:hypothetical protein
VERGEVELVQGGVWPGHRCCIRANDNAAGRDLGPPQPTRLLLPESLVCMAAARRTSGHLVAEQSEPSKRDGRLRRVMLCCLE